MEFLSDDLHKYIAGHTTQAPAYLDELERETWVKELMPRMLSGHVQGQILKMFSSMLQPTYILEVEFLNQLNDAHDQRTGGISKDEGQSIWTMFSRSASRNS